MNNFLIKSHDINTYHGFSAFTISLHAVYMYSTMNHYSSDCKEKTTNLRGN